MNIRPDLHMHTTASDGALSPMQLANRAAAAGVTVMAVTDHDSFRGADSLRACKTPIPVIPGVELSIRGMKNLHLLGYGISEAAELRQTVEDLAFKRENRAAQILEKLTAMGMPLQAETITYEGTLGRPHIARAMVKAGYVQSVQEAFERYLGDDKPAYVSGERLSMEEALPLMRRNGFVPVLAHPIQLGKDETTLQSLLTYWQSLGLMGVEVYHPSQTAHGYGSLDRMVRRMGLLVTGGSDFHVEDDNHGLPGCTADDWQQAEQDFAALQEAIDRMNRLFDEQRHS